MTAGQPFQLCFAVENRSIEESRTVLNVAIAIPVRGPRA
jgi:hypothetical protein